jgi:cytochrome c553
VVCEKREGDDMSQSLKAERQFLLALASVFLVSHLTSALADPAALEKASQCTVCHGTQGQGAPGGVPRLAGQNADYMNHALSMFKAGTRVSAIMQPIARNLSDLEIRQLADYFSSERAPLPAGTASGSSQLVLAGKQLAETGAANVAACFSCHAPQGRGNGARFPSIAAEPEQFVVNRLHEFQARAQGKAPQPGTMTAVAATLDDKQIEAAAAYLSQLQP